MKFPLLKSISAENMNKVIEKTLITYFLPNFLIIKQGAVGRYFYGVIDGRAKVLKDGKEVGRKIGAASKAELLKLING